MMSHDASRFRSLFTARQRTGGMGCVSSRGSTATGEPDGSGHAAAFCAAAGHPQHARAFVRAGYDDQVTLAHLTERDLDTVRLAVWQKHRLSCNDTCPAHDVRKVPTTKNALTDESCPSVVRSARHPTDRLTPRRSLPSYPPLDRLPSEDIHLQRRRRRRAAGASQAAAARQRAAPGRVGDVRRHRGARRIRLRRGGVHGGPGTATCRITSRIDDVWTTRRRRRRRRGRGRGGGGGGEAGRGGFERRRR